MSRARSSILVAAIGNEFAGGDAFGPGVARELAARGVEGADILDLGMDPSRLIDHLPGRDALVLIDAAVTDAAAAGRLIDCPWEDCAPAIRRHAQASTHGISVADQLELARLLGRLPRTVWLVAVTVSDGRLGEGAADAVRGAVLAAADAVVARVEALGAEQTGAPRA